MFCKNRIENILSNLNDETKYDYFLKLKMFLISNEFEIYLITNPNQSLLMLEVYLILIKNKSLFNLKELSQDKKILPNIFLAFSSVCDQYNKHKSKLLI